VTTPNRTLSTPQDVRQAAEEFRSDFTRVREQVGRVSVGQDRVVESVLMCLFVGGHVLLEGVPGIGKTLLIRTLSRALELSFSRVQFTPDLMPADITGTTVIAETDDDQGRRQRSFRFQPGPIFANIVLADEINRATPKTQSALLEAMQERAVTVGGQTHPLPDPFLVMATQNPVEQEGTYPLPEAQLDRFMFQVRISYPSVDEEAEIVRRTTSGTRGTPEAVLSSAEIRQVQDLVRSAAVPDYVIRYALRLVRATRVSEPMDAGVERPALVKNYVGWGAGPRASEYLILAAKARAILSGSFHVTPEHVKAVAKPVLRHRILTNFNAEADQVTTDKIVDGMLQSIPVEGATPAEKRQMDAVLR
jgi:MoxR-like ATPase